MNRARTLRSAGVTATLVVLVLAFYQEAWNQEALPPVEPAGGVSRGGGEEGEACEGGGPGGEALPASPPQPPDHADAEAAKATAPVPKVGPTTPEGLDAPRVAESARIGRWGVVLERLELDELPLSWFSAPLGAVTTCIIASLLYRRGRGCAREAAAGGGGRADVPDPSAARPFGATLTGGRGVPDRAVACPAPQEPGRGARLQVGGLGEDGADAVPNLDLPPSLMSGLAANYELTTLADYLRRRALGQADRDARVLMTVSRSVDVEDLLPALIAEATSTREGVREAYISLMRGQVSDWEHELNRPANQEEEPRLTSELLEDASSAFLFSWPPGLRDERSGGMIGPGDESSPAPADRGGQR